MSPKIFEVDPLHIDMEVIKQAAEVIHNRGLVAFPTETVYGLGANALDPKAVSRIFEAKKRPLDDPIIVHIADKDDLNDLVEEIPQKAQKLIDCFWPGPLTLILKKTEKVPDLVTTGLDTVAVRMPSNDIARKLIEISKVPIAAPSANLFGRPSPTIAQHVIDDLGDEVSLLIDGGSAEIGVESTVVECTKNEVIILRPGGISLEDLSSVVQGVYVYAGDKAIDNAPGKYPRHYSPKARVIIVDDTPDQANNTLTLAADFSDKGDKVGILAKQENAEFYLDYNSKVLGPGDDPRICAARLFYVLREFDSEEMDIIIAEAVKEDGLGLAIMNRLYKASGPDYLSEY